MPETTNTLGQILSGDESFSDIVGLTQQQLLAIAALGFNLYQEGQMDDARTLFAGLTAVSPKLHYGHAGLGAIALVEGKYPEAVEHLTEAARLEPGDASVQANLGEALLRNGDAPSAGEHLGKALSLDPDGRDDGANRARALLQGLAALDGHLSELATA